MSGNRFAAAPSACGVVAAVVAVEDERWNAVLPDAADLAEATLERVASELRLAPGTATELGLTLADDPFVQKLNAEWRGKNKPTNVLSFPMLDLSPGEAPGPMLGDLVLALETLEREAKAEIKPLADHFRHLVVHGTLHCFGFDHETQADAEAMEALEVRILATLGVADPYREFDLQKEPARA